MALDVNAVVGHGSVLALLLFIFCTNRCLIQAHWNILGESVTVRRTKCLSLSSEYSPYLGLCFSLHRMMTN